LIPGAASSHQAMQGSGRVTLWLHPHLAALTLCGSLDDVGRLRFLHRCFGHTPPTGMVVNMP